MTENPMPAIADQLVRDLATHVIDDVGYNETNTQQALDIINAATHGYDNESVKQLLTIALTSSVFALVGTAVAYAQEVGRPVADVMHPISDVDTGTE